MKRILAFLLAVILAAGCVPALGLTAHAIPTSGSAGKNITWKMHDDGTLVFSGRGAMDDNQQHFVKDWVSYYWQDITNVVFEEGITYIGAWSFSMSRALPRVRSVTIPSTVTKIGEYAFVGMGNLREVHITSLEKWLKIEFCGNGSNPLENCAALHLNGERVENLVIPKTVSQIPEKAFFGCTSIKTVEIPKSVTGIGSFAFNSCYNLGKVIFYGNAPQIGESIFVNVRANAYYPQNNSTWYESVRSDFLGTVKWKTFDPNTDNVTSDEFPGATPTGYVEWEMNEKTGVLTIGGYGEMKNFSSSGGPWMELHKYQIKSIVVKEGVTRIGDNAFRDLPYLSSVKLPNSLKSIGGHAFDGCYGLTKIVLPPAIDRLGAQIFDQINQMEVTFTGGAPRIMGTTHFQHQSTIYYPADNATWTREAMQNFSGKVSWVAVGKLAPNGNEVTRLFGAYRYVTAFRTAEELKYWLGTDKFENIIVTSGSGFADALAGSYLAAMKSAPILLAHAQNSDDLKDYIKANLKPGGTVYLLGGVNAVSQSMESGLDDFSVKRLGGATRYETNLQILQEAGIAGKDLIVCTGTNFADSLSASATGRPILLVQDKLTPAQKEFLAGISGNIIVVGGVNAVGTAVEAQLAEYGTVKRLAGSNRYETSVLVAKEFFGKPSKAVLAYAQNFPDGLCGGPLAYTLGGPLLLTGSNIETEAMNYAKGVGIKSGYVLGGVGLINDKTVRNIFSREEKYPIIAN